VVDTVVAMTVIEVVDTVAMIVIEEVDTMMMIDMDILVVIMYSEELMMLSDRSMNILEEIMEEITKIIMHHLLNQHNQVQNLIKFNLERVKAKNMATFQRKGKMKILQRTFLKKMVMMKRHRILKKRKNQRKKKNLKSIAKSRKNTKRSTAKRQRKLIKMSKMKKLLCQRKMK
jgi:hypothetical protein